METWGFCDDCARWFYCTQNQTEWACPVCGARPAKAVDRPA